MSQRPKPCPCPSCTSGLTCYRTNVEVALPGGRTGRRLLYGEMLLLAKAMPEQPILHALRRRQTIRRAGVIFEPTRRRTPKEIHGTAAADQ